MKEFIETENLEIPKPKGKILIELFNGDGTKDAEFKKDNYVSPFAYDEMKKMIPFYKSLSGYYNSSSARQGFTLLDKVTGILLVNNDEAIDEQNHRFIRGDIVGCGDQNTTTANARYGSMNVVESVTKETTYKKLVFDFPTSSGNGTFTDIYGLAFDGGYGRPVPDQKFNFWTYFRTRSAFSTFDAVWKVGDQFYTVKYVSGALIELYKYDKLEYIYDSSSTGSEGNYYLGESDGSDATKTSVNFPSNLNGASFAFDDSYFYVYSAGDRKLYRASLSNPASAVLVKTFTSAEVPDNSGVVIAYNKHDGFLYLVTVKRDLSNLGYIVKVDKANFLPLSKDNFKPTEYYNTGALFTPSYAMFDEYQAGILNTGGNIIDVYDKRIIYSAYFGNGTYTYYYSFVGKYLLAKNMISSNSSFFSRVKLESPVTKTSSQTMKITYEWTMPKPDLSL